MTTTAARRGWDAYNHMCRELLKRWGVADAEGNVRFPEEERDWYAEQTPPTEEDLAAMTTRAHAATPGPWYWTHDLVNAYKKAARPRRLRERYVFLMQGRPRGPYMDQHDCQVLKLAWYEVKGSGFYGAPGEEDMTFMAHARADVPRLVAEVRRLRAEVARLQAQGKEGDEQS